MRRISSEDEEVYLTPKHLLDEKVQHNVLGQIVPRKQNPIIEDDTDLLHYTLARAESFDEEVTQPTGQLLSNIQRRETRGIYDNRYPKHREEPVRMSSVDEEVYLTPKHLLDDKVRQNVLGQVVVKKKVPIMGNENDTDGQNYTLAKIDSLDEEVSQPSQVTISNRKSRGNRSICEGISKWKYIKSVAVVGIICILLVAIGISVYFIMKRGKENRGNKENILLLEFHSLKHNIIKRVQTYNSLKC